jgi:ABC-type lipoprotein export system ATPase subunit
MKVTKRDGIMIKLTNVSKYYYSKNNVVMALRRINIELKIGEFIAITGESGSGKSTLLNVISGLDTYEEGKMEVFGNDISHYSVEELETYRREYIAFVFQDYNIIDSYSVLDNVLMALIVQGMSKNERLEQAKMLIEKVGLTEQMHQKASKLSGGEQQRTVIARALAKNSPVIVCDEPTGNLDSTSANQILTLLHEISKDKLVIVVTHNFAQIESFVTRKIRLYDGEIVEDVYFKKADLIEQKPPLKSFIFSLKDTIKVAFLNVTSVPKKTIFSLIIFGFMFLAFIFAYGFTLEAKNTPYQDETPYFSNAFDGRVIVTKRDNTFFTDNELSEINNVKHVREVIENDIVFDSVLVNDIFNPEYNYTVFYKYKVLPSSALDEYDLLSGELPKSQNEVVIGDSGLYDIGDYINMANEATIMKIENETIDQFVFKVVGIVNETIEIDGAHEIYLHVDALDSLSYSSNYENASVFLDIDNLRQYAIYDQIRIDNTLPLLEIKMYDMLFFDICRDFGYKEEVVDDFDAGLCPVEDYFLPYHDYNLAIVTRFENKPVATEVVLSTQPVEPHIYGQVIYMSQATYEAFFVDDPYQVTAVVYDMFEAQQVKTDLEEMGYNVFYPAGVLGEDNALNVVLKNLQLSMTLGLTLIAVYFVGYFVMRNILISKHKDYVIYRSVGTSKKSIKNIMIGEVFIQSLIAFVIVIALLIINEFIKSPVPKLLRYFTLGSYVFMIVIIIIMMYILATSFNRKLFAKSVITSLRAE